MKIDKSKIDIFGQELTLLVKTLLKREGLFEWFEGVAPEFSTSFKTNEYRFLITKDKLTGNYEMEEDFAIEFLVFIMWAVSYTIQQFFLKKNTKPKIVVSRLNPHLEENIITEESAQILDMFHREIYKWLERAWKKKDLSTFEEFINIRYRDYYYSTGLMGPGLEMPSFASGMLAKIIGRIEEKSKQNWIERLKKTDNKREIKNIIIDRYFIHIFKDTQRLVKDIYRKIKK